jgi:hypothetical protein
MEITSKVEWDEVEDRAILLQFLQTRTGQRLIPKMAEAVPVLLAKGDSNEILIRSGEVRGWQAALSTIMELVAVSAPVNVRPAGAYPDPENDDEWSDSPKQ